MRRDHLPCLFEGLELVAPDAAFLEVAKPRFDERLALGVTVAAAAVTNTEPRDHEPRRTSGERRAVIGAQGERPREDGLLEHRSFDNGDRLDRAAAQAELPANDLAGAAVDDRVQIDPAVLGDPDTRHVEMPELAGPLDLEEPGPPALGLARAPLDQVAFAHLAQHPLAVRRPPQLARHPGSDDR